MRIFIRYWLPLFIYCGLIYFASTMTSFDPEIPLFRINDKILHMIQFGMLGFLAVRTLAKGTGDLFTQREAFVLTILFAAFYGALDELHQSFVPNRYMEFADVVADVAGATLPAGVYLVGSIFVDRLSAKRAQSRQIKKTANAQQSEE